MVVAAIGQPNGGSSFDVHGLSQPTMQPKPSPSATLRLAEIMATLSLATDLGMGQPLEFALTGCVLATRMGESLGLPTSDLRDVYYFGLLRFIGCNSDTYAIAALLGDELSLRSAFAAVDPGSTAAGAQSGDPFHAPGPRRRPAPGHGAHPGARRAQHAAVHERPIQRAL